MPYFCSTIWIRSPRPFLIEISLRMIQDMVREDGHVHPDCFNLAVRHLSIGAVVRNAGTQFLGSTHLFDLQFHAQARALRQSWICQERRTTVLIDTVVVQPFPKYDVLSTPHTVRIFNLKKVFVYYYIWLQLIYFYALQYLLPLALTDSSYGLIVVNMKERRTCLIDPSNLGFLHDDDLHENELKKEP